MYATACARCRRRPITSGCSSAKIFFVAFGAIIFMHNFMLESGGIQTEPLHIALWGIPTRSAPF
ncbi:FIG015373: Membrane protein [Klebsiella pneumoniae ISC21]|nr:FIG015373: Membrane protein [Klebsiella pneumoniae ISC21]